MGRLKIESYIEEKTKTDPSQNPIRVIHAELDSRGFQKKYQKFMVIYGSKTTGFNNRRRIRF